MLSDADKQTTDTQTTFPTETEDGELIETIEDDDVFTEEDPGIEEVEDSFYENTEEDVTQEGEEEEDLNPNLEDTAQSVQDAKETSEQLISKLNEILEKGEQTSEDIAEINSLKETYTQSYNNAKSDLEKTPYDIINEQLQLIKESMVGATIDEILDILTDEGRKPWLYKDEDNNVLVDMSSIPELTVLVNKLNLIATDGENASEIQLTPEFINLISNSNICLAGDQIKITGDTVIEGLVTANENCKINTDGSLTCKKANITGAITATGNIVLYTNDKGFRGRDTENTEVTLVHIDKNNCCRFGWGSWISNSALAYNAGSEFLGGQKAVLRSRGNTYLVCNGGTYDATGGSALVFLNNSSDDYTFRPVVTDKDYLGTDTYRWKKVYSISADDISSDRELKENIKYIESKNLNVLADMVDSNSGITYENMYNFIRDDLDLAKYNYKGNNNSELGFIAQDILVNEDGTDNIIGQTIVNPAQAVKSSTEDEKCYLSYNTGNYMHVIAGALKKSISIIEELSKRIEELENKNKE